MVKGKQLPTHLLHHQYQPGLLPLQPPACWLVLLPVFQLTVLATVPGYLTPGAPAALPSNQLQLTQLGQIDTAGVVAA